MRVQTAQTTRSLVSEMVWQIEQGRDSAMPPRLLTRPKQRRCGVKSKVHMGRRASRAPGKAPARPSFSQIVRMTQASLSVNERSGDDQASCVAIWTVQDIPARFGWPHLKLQHTGWHRPIGLCAALNALVARSMLVYRSGRPCVMLSVDVRKPDPRRTQRRGSPVRRGTLPLYARHHCRG